MFQTLELYYVKQGKEEASITHVSLFVLASRKVTGKIIAVSAPVSAYVTLERVLITMAAHVDGVEDVVREINVTVGAVVEHLGVLYRGGCPWLAVGTARSAGSLTAGSNSWATAAVCSRSGLGGDGRRSLSRTDRDGCGCHHRLVDKERGFFIG